VCQSHSLLRSLNAVTLETGYVIGDSVNGSSSYSSTGTNGVGAAARLPPITATTMDSAGNLYWTDSIGGVRFLNTTSNQTANYCVCSSPPCSAKFYSGFWTWWDEYISCSQLAMVGASTGLVLDSSSGIMYVAINATAPYNPTALDSQIIAVLDAVAYQFCGSGSTIVSSSDCGSVVYQAPQNLLLYGGALFFLEPSIWSVRWISLTYTNGFNGGFLLGCPRANLPNCAASGSGMYAAGSSSSVTQLVAPTAMAIDANGYLYIADSNLIRICQITGGTNPVCGQQR
jgi:hypothetical protein